MTQKLPSLDPRTNLDKFNAGLERRKKANEARNAREEKKKKAAQAEISAPARKAGYEAYLELTKDEREFQKRVTSAKNELVRAEAKKQRAAEKKKQRELTEAELADKEAASRILSRRRLLPFIQRFNEDYEAGWVHMDICRRLERFSDQVARREAPHLMLLMPPRHGKSEIASRRFPAWHLGRHPKHEIIACSYALDLVTAEFSRPVREMLRDPAYHVVFPHTRLSSDSQGIENWKTTKGGGYTAAGVGGPITGKGAHVLLIDDPVKNAEEADSEIIREKLWSWYGSTAYTRRAPGAGVLLIQTWWHDDDLAGRIMEAMKGVPGYPQFEVVRYPAIADADEWEDPDTWDIYRCVPDTRVVQEGKLQELPEKAVLVRKKGEPLHAARYGLEDLLRIKASLLPRHWSALYQQNPVPDEGAYFSKNQFVNYEPGLDVAICQIYQAWDFAITEKQAADWCVGVTLAQDWEGAVYVLEVVRFRGDSFRICKEILDMYARWRTAGLGEPAFAIENGQIWKAIKPLLKVMMMDRQLFPVVEGDDVELNPITDKQARARTLQGYMQQGRVRYPTTAQWFEHLQQELIRFPNGKHDDQVDSLAWAFIRLARGALPPKPRERYRRKTELTVEQKLRRYARGGGRGHVASSHMSA